MSYFMHLTNPFRPMLEKEVSEIRAGTRIDTVLKREKLIVRGKRVRPYVVMLNDKPLLQAQWCKRLKKDDILLVSQLPGSGGGGGGSNPMRMLLTVALIAVAVYTGGVAAGMYGAATGAAAGVTTTGMAVVNAVVSAAVMITGTMLLNMIFPVKTDTLSSRQAAETSPTYTFGDAGNQARLLQAIPVLYGRFCTYPDLITQPYVEARGNEQYIYELMCITQGACDVESIMIGDEDVSSFSEVQYEVIQPGGQVTLFPDNVVTSASVAGNTLFAPNQDGYAVLGPFVTSPPGTVVDHIAVDVSAPGGMLKAEDDGSYSTATANFYFDAQLIDDTGAAIGPWNNVINDSISGASQQPQMRTYKVAIAPGRYQVRGSRVNNAGGDHYSDAIRWDALKGYIPSTRTYGNVTLIAMIAKATNNLNGSLARKVSVVAKRKLQTWNPVDGWSASNVVTSNPAWAIADALRNTDYGRGMPDTYYNLQELYRLAQVWDTRGDEFNGVFDTTVQFWDALSSLCAVGRAVPMYYAGVVDIIRNEPQTIPSRVFTPQNITASSFSTRYIFPEVDTPDFVQVEYTDDTTWATETVDCILPGSPGLNPSKVSIIGITNRNQAWREGISLAAKNRDQRRLTSFTTGMEGALTRYGEMVSLSHDVPGWGYFGRIESFTIVSPGVARVITTEPLTFIDGVTHYMAFRTRAGKQDGPYVCTPIDGGFENECQVTGTTAAIGAIYISDGVREDLTQYQFGPSDRMDAKVIILAAKPAKDGSVALSVVNYADSVHKAENGGAVPIPPPITTLPGVPVLPIIANITLQLTVTVGKQNIVITAAPGADYYEYQISNDGVSWTALATTADLIVPVTLTTGTWWVRARGVGQAAGPWSTWTGQVDATSLPTPELSNLFASTNLLWSIQIDVVLGAGHANIAKSWELWSSDTNDRGTATKLVELPFPATRYLMDNLDPGVTKYFWARVRDTANRLGLWANGGVGVVGQSSSDVDLLMNSLAGKISETQLAQELADKIDSGGGANVQVQEIKNDLAAMYTIKTQLTSGNRTALAGIGVGVENTEGILESQVLFTADRFAFVLPGDSSGTAVYPFIVNGVNTYIANAFIQNASINGAKISDWLESDATGAGGARILRLNFRTGEIQLNAPVSGGGRMQLTNSLIQVFDSSGRLRVRLGIW